MIQATTHGPTKVCLFFPILEVTRIERKTSQKNGALSRHQQVSRCIMATMFSYQRNNSIRQSPPTHGINLVLVFISRVFRPTSWVEKGHFWAMGKLDMKPSPKLLPTKKTTPTSSCTIPKSRPRSLRKQQKDTTPPYLSCTKNWVVATQIICYFHPENWGRWFPIWLNNFQMGGFNHQPENDLTILFEPIKGTRKLHWKNHRQKSANRHRSSWIAWFWHYVEPPELKMSWWIWCARLRVGGRGGCIWCQVFSLTLDPTVGMC